MRRLTKLPGKQRAFLLASVTLGGASMVAGGLGAFELAWALIAGLLLINCLAILESRRRIGEIRNTFGARLSRVEHNSSRADADNEQFRERRLLAAIEGERLAAAERHAELSRDVRELREKLERLSGDYAPEGKAGEDKSQ